MKELSFMNYCVLLGHFRSWVLLKRQWCYCLARLSTCSSRGGPGGLQSTHWLFLHFPDGDQASNTFLCKTVFFLVSVWRPGIPWGSSLLYELSLVAVTHLSLFPRWPGSYTQYMLDSLILFSTVTAGSALWGFALTGTVENHLFKNQSPAATSQMLLNLEVFQLQPLQSL